MSHYDWERGTIVLPTAAWAGFKKTLREAYNKAIAEDYQTAVRLHEAAKAAIKGKRGVDLRAVIAEVAARATPASGYGYGYRGPREEFKFKVTPDYKAVEALLKKGEKPEGKPKLQTPKKASFAPATSATDSYSCDGEASIRLDNKAHSVTWSVSENNHACERARETYMGGVLFEALRKVKWTRGSGGTIVGNDEYRSESDELGGGGNYLKDRFGPAGDKAYEDHTGLRLRSTRSVSRGMRAR